MSQWDKLITDILHTNPNLRFEQLCKALTTMGFSVNQPRNGSSHCTFRKEGCTPITLPKQSPMNRVYIKLVAETVRAYLEEDETHG